MDNIFNLFQGYLGTVALGAGVLGILCGLIGTFTFLRGESLIGDVVSHSALPGIVMAFIFTGIRQNATLLPGAVLSGILAMAIILIVTGNSKIKFDTSLALVLSTFFGFGLVLLSYLQKMEDAGQAGLESYIFGQAASFLRADLYLILGALAVALLAIIILYKEFKLFSFDPDFALALGYNTGIINFILSILIVLTVVVGLQTVGVILMSAMLIGPAAAARQWSDRLLTVIILASIIGFISGFFGTLLSLYGELPTGPSIIMVLMILVFISLIAAPKRGIIAKEVGQRKMRRTFREILLMEKLEEVNSLNIDSITIRDMSSDDIYSKIDDLVNYGYLIKTEKGYQVTESGKAFINRELKI